jgi:hypothetical protein
LCWFFGTAVGYVRPASRQTATLTSCQELDDLPDLKTIEAKMPILQILEAKVHSASHPSNTLRLERGVSYKNSSQATVLHKK